MDMDKLMAGLNESQKQAVLATEGYVRVIAGAGSGKTRALTARFAYLVEEVGISPENILCVTFTNKAAREMRVRLRQMLGDGIDISFVSTLHSFCVRVLREDIGRLFYPENFVILDGADQKDILEEVYEELGIKMDTATFEFMVNKIRYYKNRILYEDYLAPLETAIGVFDEVDIERKVVIRYMEKQKKYFGLDFFDIINFTVHLFKMHEDVLNKWQERLFYVMYDEFQDVNNKELRLIRILTDFHQNLFVVGDPDQNIYEWRASKPSFLVQFDQYIHGYFKGEDLLPTYWPNHPIPPLRAEITTVFLNENYRSTPEIINASNSLIEKNQNRIEKRLYTNRPGGAAVEHFHAKNDAAEIKYIADIINAHVAQKGKYADIAVLYRSSYISRFVEQGFLKHNIPYMVFGSIGFFERREIKDALSYLRLAGIGDDLSFKRIINIPRRMMGRNRIAFLNEKANEENATLYETLKNHIDDPIFKGTGAKKFLTAIEAAKNSEMPVSEVFKKLLVDTGYDDYIRKSGEMERFDNVAELMRSIVALETDYGEPLTLTAFLQDVSLNRDLEETDKKDAVKIMTAHISKGLEFHTVIIAGMSEKTFPSARALEEKRQYDTLEEERRLAYVAMTRAKERLVITESEGFGFRGYTKTPSRFLFEIDDKYITRIGEINDDIMAEFKIQTANNVSFTQNYLAAGSRVKHKIFGEGVIEDVNDRTRTYLIRFITGVKPIRFDYQGITQI